MSYTRRSLNSSRCTSKETIAAVHNKILPNPCLSSLHSSHLLLHHLRSLFQGPQKTRSMLMRGLRNPLSKSWTALNCSPVRRATKNSPSRAGWTPRSSMTGRGRSTGTWQNGAKTVAQSATGRAGVGRAWCTTLRRGFGTWTNPGRFELAGGQCYDFHRFSGLIFFFPCVLLIIFIVLYSSFHLDWSCASKAVLVNMQHNFHYLHTACRQHDDLVAALLYTAFIYKLLFKP